MILGVKLVIGGTESKAVHSYRLIRAASLLDRQPVITTQVPVRVVYRHQSVTDISRARLRRRQRATTILKYYIFILFLVVAKGIA